VQAETSETNFLLTQHNHSTHENQTPQNVAPSTQDFPQSVELEPIPADWGEPIHDHQTFGAIKVEQLEYRWNDDAETFNWDLQAWRGGDYRRFQVNTEGEIGLDESSGEMELELLSSHLIAPFWEFQWGAKYEHIYDAEDSDGRAFATIGLQGLAPYLFEIDTDLSVSHEGDISASFAVEQDFLLTQKLVLQPEFKTNIAIQTVDDFGVGSGINDIELGLRLRYEINRNFVPYLGINWHQKLFETADLAQKEGEETSNLSLVGGVRLLF
jgi:copper resistance protein B